MRNAQFCAVQVQDGSCVTSIACPNGVAATVRDEGRSFEVGNQVLISSHRTLPSLMRWPIACAMQHGVPQRVDAVEKVVGMSAVRNNRIIGADFLNGAFAFGACIESILLGDPPQNLFSTASVKTREADGLAVSFRPLAALDQEQEPERADREARSRGGLGR
jgi:hypothetical protein